MANHPRATMGELAELAGVSRATLNRHCGTREGLKRRLESHARSTLERLSHSAALQRLEPREALRELIREHLVQRDLLALLMFEQNPGRQAGHGDTSWQSYIEALDAF
ncbi:TetR/AcrR family transcriptional regulator, partial [Pseudomonas aeruginosa]